MTTRLALAATLVTTLGATGVAQAAKHHHHHSHPHHAKAGSAYKGTIGDGTIEFTVAGDGKSIEKGLSISTIDVHCEHGDDHPITKIAFEHSFAITGNHVSYTHHHAGSVTRLSLSFGKGGAATGTINLHIPPPPPPPAGAIPPGATYVSTGACDTGDVDFKVQPASRRR